MCGYFDHCFECVFLLLCSLVTLLFSPLTDDIMVWGPQPRENASCCAPLGDKPLLRSKLQSKTNTVAEKGWTSCKRAMRREGSCDAAGEVNDTFALSLVFPAPENWRTTSGACKFTPAGPHSQLPHVFSICTVQESHTNNISRRTETPRTEIQQPNM